MMAFVAFAPGCRCDDRAPRQGPRLAPPAPVVSPTSARSPAPAAQVTPTGVPAALTPIDDVARRPAQTELQLRGLDDAGPLLDRALKGLRQQWPILTGEGPVALQRVGGQGRRDEKLALAGDFTATLAAAGTGLEVATRGPKCVVSAGVAPAGMAQAACPLAEAAAVRTLAGLALLARHALDPKLALAIETLHGTESNQPVRLRLRSLALAERWTLTLEPRSGFVVALGVHIKGRLAELRLDQAKTTLTLHIGAQIAASWLTGARPGAFGTESTQTFLKRDVGSLQEAETAIARLRALAVTLGGVAVSPDVLVAQWRGGELRAVAVQVPVILPAAAQHTNIRRLAAAAGPGRYMQARDGDLAAGLRAAGVAEGCYRMLIIGQPEGMAEARQRDAVVALSPCSGL